LEILVDDLSLNWNKTFPDLVPGEITITISIETLEKFCNVVVVGSKLHSLHGFEDKYSKHFEFIRLEMAISVFIGNVEHLSACFPEFTRGHCRRYGPTELFGEDLGVNRGHALPDLFPAKFSIHVLVEPLEELIDFFFTIT
jgi:hypothetical protein